MYSIRAAIIGLCLCLLSGCSALRIGYNQGETLAWWWIDAYVDFNGEQAPIVKQAVRQWFVWHRRGQLPDYAALLSTAQAEVLQPLTTARVCRWADDIRARIDTSISRAAQLAAPIVPSLNSPQLAHIEGHFRKVNDEFREEYLQDSPEARLKEGIQRAVERGEMLYGKLNEEQSRLVAAGMADSPFDAALWLAERQRRQRDILQVLRRLSAPGGAPLDRATVVAALQALAVRAQQPSDAYALYQRRLTDYNCELAAQLHNTTTAKQRQVARDRLKGWEEDLRSLIAQVPAQAGG
ncbi:MAG: DUF6279 family lipoprotein [Rubrivivax sp.]